MNDVSANHPVTGSTLAPGVPGRWVLLLGELLTDRGIASEPVFRACGIELERINTERSRVSYDQFLAMVEQSLRLSGDASLGFDLGLRGRISDFGVLGYALASSATLGRAIGLASRYYWLFRPFINFSYEINPPYVDATAEESLPVQRFRRFAYEATLGCMASLGRFLLVEPLRLTRLELNYSAPPHAERYSALFQCPVVFDAPRCCLRFPSSYLDAPLKLADPEVAAMCEEQCARWLNRVGGGQSLVARTRKELLRVPGEFPDIGAIARALDTSSRSLSRDLAALNTSYQSLLDDVRQEIALDYLQTTPLSVEQIAQLVGYSDASNFRKAFKNWTGKTPNQYRNGSR